MSHKISINKNKQANKISKSTTKSNLSRKSDPSNKNLYSNDTSRPSFELIYMKLAIDLEKRSTCERKKVGCVITTEDYEHVCGIGYNGNAPGEQNCCDRPLEARNCGCEHAESNALLKVNTASITPKILFTTWSPCCSCAKKILIKKGIKKIFYLREYSDKSGLILLNSHGIETIKLTID